MSEKRVSVIIPYKTSTCVVIMVPTLYDKCNKNKFIKTLYNCMQFIYSETRSYMYICKSTS